MIYLRWRFKLSRVVYRFARGAENVEASRQRQTKPLKILAASDG